MEEEEEIRLICLVVVEGEDMVETECLLVEDMATERMVVEHLLL